MYIHILRTHIDRFAAGYVCTNVCVCLCETCVHLHKLRMYMSLDACRNMGTLKPFEEFQIASCSRRETADVGGQPHRLNGTSEWSQLLKVVERSKFVLVFQGRSQTI